MMIAALTRRLLDTLGFVERSFTPRLAIAIAIVVFDREDLSAIAISLKDEQEIVARLSQSLKGTCDYDGADWSIDLIRWFFLGKDVEQVERALLAELRGDPRCKGALLRVTANGIGGPWRETRI
jgi:hypothetical protein